MWPAYKNEINLNMQPVHGKVHGVMLRQDKIVQVSDCSCTLYPHPRMVYGFLYVNWAQICIEEVHVLKKPHDALCLLDFAVENDRGRKRLFWDIW